MAVADLLEKIGEGAKTVGRVAGAVAEPLAKRTAEVVSGEAPEIDQEKRQRAEKLEDEQLAIKASTLENNLAMGQKYGTLTPDQQQQYVDEITKIYSNPRHAPTLMEKLRKAIHPDGTFAQAPQKTLENPTPEGGTLHADTLAAMMKAKPNYQNFKTPEGKIVTIDENREQPGPGWTKVGNASGIPRSLGFGIGPQQAIIAMQTTNQQFAKPDGTFYTAAELAALPPTTQLRAYASGGEVFYGIADQTQHTVTIGNMVYKMDQFGDIDPNAPLGVARVGSTSTQTAPGGGQVVTATTKPNVAGALTGAKPVSPTAPPSATGARPVNPGALNSLPKVTKPTATQPQSIFPDLSRVPYKFQSEAQKLKPVVVAEAGLYGDPGHPTVPSMMDYAKLADDPHAQKTLGEAFKLLDQQMGEISDPGVLQTLGTAAGWANFRAQAESGAQQAAGTQMTPEERAYFDAAIRSMADIIGARSATGQSAARFSVRAIQNELPLIGLSGTPDSQSYFNKMQGILVQIRGGLDGMPDNGRAMAWLNRREAEIAKQKSSVAGALGKKIKVQHSASTGQDRWSDDGGVTWNPGKPPQSQ